MVRALVGKDAVARLGVRRRNQNIARDAPVVTARDIALFAASRSIHGPVRGDRAGIQRVAGQHAPTALRGCACGLRIRARNGRPVLLEWLRRESDAELGPYEFAAVDLPEFAGKIMRRSLRP